MVSSMGRCQGTGNIVGRLGLILAGLLVTLTAWALDSITPVHYRYTGITGTGVNTTATWRLAKSGAPSLYAERQFATSFSSLGGVAKNIVKRGGAAGLAYMAAEAVIQGAGWAIDELTKQVLSGPRNSSVPVGTIVFSPLSSGQQGGVWGRAIYSTVNQACQGAGKENAGGRYVLVSATPSGGRSPAPSQSMGYHYYGCTVEFLVDGASQYITQMYVYEVVSTEGNHNNVKDQAPPEISDDELGRKIAEDKDAVNQLLEAGGVVQMTPELLAQQNALKASKAEQAGEPAPAPDMMPTSEEQANKEPEESEWPKFCTWASYVCEWIDWTKEEGEEVKKDVPSEEVTLPDESWASGLPTDASCPSVGGISFSLMGQSVNEEISMVPLCTALEMLRPIIIAVSLLIAAYIIGGVRSSDV